MKRIIICLICAMSLCMPVHALEETTPHDPIDERRVEVHQVYYQLSYPFNGVIIDGVYSVDSTGNVISSDLTVYSSNPTIAIIGGLDQYPDGRRVRCVFTYYSYLTCGYDNYTVYVQ
ncbi:MAG: hypothetical protein HUJ57_05400 [Erysipelotrichaceae bacterium]|nr:hypothetical protein [Erysipelotrichaceae bacterium]